MSSVRALPMTFVIYVFEAVLALLAGLPAALELTRTAPHGADASSYAEWLEFLLGLGAPSRVASVSALLTLLLLGLLSPWLQMAWLSALARRESLGTSLATGARLWMRALWVTIPVALGIALALAPFGLAAWGISRLSAARLNDRVHDLGILCALLPALPITLAGFVWLDLARARALHEGAWTCAARSLRSAVQPLTIARAALWNAGGCVPYLLVHAALSERLSASPLLVAALQTAVLLRLLFRSRWLADALTCAERSGASGAQPAYE